MHLPGFKRSSESVHAFLRVGGALAALSAFCLGACGTEPPATTQQRGSSNALQGDAASLFCAARSVDESTGAEVLWTVTSNEPELATIVLSASRGDSAGSAGSAGSATGGAELRRDTSLMGASTSPSWSGQVELPGVYSATGKVELDALARKMTFTRFDGRVLPIPCTSVPELKEQGATNSSQG
jgi:hypothetical protein